MASYELGRQVRSPAMSVLRGAVLVMPRRRTVFPNEAYGRQHALIDVGPPVSQLADGFSSKLGTCGPSFILGIFIFSGPLRGFNAVRLR